MTAKKIQKIEKDYKSGMKYKDIEAKNKISHGDLRSLIKSQKWKRKSNRSEVQKGNKNAVVTGEYESIFADFYSDEEKLISQKIKDIDEIEAIKHEVELYTIKECRILEKIADLKNSGKDMAVTSITRNKEYTTEDGGFSTEGTSTFIEDTKVKIQRLEEALTRVQQAKVKALAMLHKIKSDRANFEFKKQVFEINNKDNKKENIDKIQDYLNKLEGVFKRE